MIRLYTQAGCHACEDAKRELMKVCSFEIVQHDGDPVIYEGLRHIFHAQGLGEPAYPVMVVVVPGEQAEVNVGTDSISNFCKRCTGAPKSAAGAGNNLQQAPPRAEPLQADR